MIGKILIVGDIGKDIFGDSTGGVDLMDIISQVKAQRDIGLSKNDPVTEFEVDITSYGGYVETGFDIYTYLTSIPETIKTIAKEYCASIATVIFLAGNKRVSYCDLMIHNPWTEVSGDADQLQAAADDIKATEEMLISFYAKHTGLEKVALDALMKQESYINPQKAFELGFSTELPTEIQTKTANYRAVAKINDSMSKETKGLMSKLDEMTKTVKNFIEGKTEPAKTPAKALDVADKDGKTLSITNSDGSEITGVPVVGNNVMVDGANAEGEFVIPSMSISITVGAGVITAVTPMADENKELETANNKIKDLETELASLKAEKEETKKDTEELAKKVLAFEAQLKAITGKSPEHQAQNRFRQPDEEKDTRPLAVRMEEAKKKLEEKKSQKK